MEKQTLALVPGRFLLRTAEPSAMTISTEYLEDDDDDDDDDVDDNGDDDDDVSSSSSWLLRMLYGPNHFVSMSLWLAPPTSWQRHGRKTFIVKR